MHMFLKHSLFWRVYRSCLFSADTSLLSQHLADMNTFLKRYHSNTRTYSILKCFFVLQGYSKFAEGTVLVFEQNYEKALKIEEEFLEIAQRLKNKPAECEVIISMTRIYCKLFNIHEALNLHHKGYKMAKELGNQKLALKAKVNQALVYALTGKYKKTYETNKQMYENLGNNEDKDFEHTVLCNLSVDALILKKHEESLKLAQDSLLVAEELGAKDCIALSYGNIGLAQEQLQQFDEAISSFEKCLEHGKKIKDKRIINNSYCNLGRAYEGKGGCWFKY